MRTETITIYRFSELSQEAKQRAAAEQQSLFGYAWSREALDSMQQLAKHFAVKVVAWSIDWYACSPSTMKFSMPEGMTKREIHRRLKELGTYNEVTLQGHGDYKLTGMCLDEAAIDGFRLACLRDNITDLRDLMEAAFASWLKACQVDAADEYSEETFGGYCEANDYEFLADGTFYKPEKETT